MAGADRRRGPVRAARPRRLHRQLLSELGGAASHQGSETRRLLPLSTLAHRLSRQPAIGRALVQAHLQHRAGGGGGDRRSDLPVQRHADHPRIARVFVLLELAARDFLHHRGASHCLADANRQSQLSPLQQADPELDGRYHAGRERGHRRFASDQDIQRRGSSDGPIRAGQRAQSRLEHEARARQVLEQSRRRGHRLGRARGPALRGHSTGICERHASRPVLGILDGADAHTLIAPQPRQHRRPVAAGRRRGAKCIRDTGHADRRRGRHSAACARAGRSSFATCRSNTRAKRAAFCTT